MEKNKIKETFNMANIKPQRPETVTEKTYRQAIVLAMDNSGTMLEEIESHGVVKTKAEFLSDAVYAFVENLGSEIKDNPAYKDAFHLGLTCFDYKSYKLVDIQSLSSYKNKYIKLEPKGMTNISDALKMANDMISSYQAKHNEVKWVRPDIFIFTDGDHTTGEPSPAEIAESIKNTTKANIICVFFGDPDVSNNIELLKNIATSESFFIIEPDPEKLRWKLAALGSTLSKSAAYIRRYPSRIIEK